MDELSKSKVLMGGLWCGIGYMVVLYLGWGFTAGFLPPTPAYLSAIEIEAIFQSDTNSIRIGMLMTMLAALVFVPFAATLSHYIARIEGGASVLTYTFLLGAAGNMCLTFYPAIWWLVGAFRPDRGADLIYLMNDMAWLQFLGGVTIYLAMPLSITVAALLDRSREPVFPRWVGFTNFWLAVMILPDQLLFFFYQGAFAWHGLFGIWIPLVVFSGFFIVNFYAVRKANLRERALLPAR